MEAVLDLEQIAGFNSGVETHWSELLPKGPFAMDGGANLWLLDPRDLTVSLAFTDEDPVDERLTELEFHEFLASLLKDEPEIDI